MVGDGTQEKDDSSLEIGSSVEDRTSSQSPVVGTLHQFDRHLIFFPAANSSCYSSEMNDNDAEHFPWPLGYVLYKYFFKSHRGNSTGQRSMRFCALSKLVYIKTQVLELIEA